MNETPNPAADENGTARTDAAQPQGGATWEAPHADPSTLRSAYAFDGSGPYLYGPDGSGPYGYTPDGRGPFLIGSSALPGFQHGWAHGAATANHAAANHGTKRPRRLGLMIGSGIAALAIVGAAGGTALGLSTQSTTTTSSQSQGSTTLPDTGSGTDSGSGTNGFTVPGDGSGSGSSDGSSGSSTESAATAATSAQKKGVVTINTVLNYDESSQAAGTGMIINSNGTVLTNNHVIQGATSITVTDETTGKEYKADVVGTDATNDVAVLKLEGASVCPP
ncbi:trypsin-like peptidase domain-containing protein [Curtobacterium flaccumfaciens]|nr:trypsin-like peptidase domain-containing protein [Curtobacterium flaccumfaciens]